MEEEILIDKVQSGELDMLGYVLSYSELKNPFMEYLRDKGIMHPTEKDAKRFLDEHEEQLYQNVMP